MVTQTTYIRNPDGSITTQINEIPSGPAIGSVSNPIGGSIESNILQESLEKSVAAGKAVEVSGTMEGIGTGPYSYGITPSANLVANVTPPRIEDQETQTTETAESRTITLPANTLTMSKDEKEIPGSRKYLGDGMYSVTYKTPTGNVTREVYDPRERSTAEWLAGDLAETLRPKEKAFGFEAIVAGLTAPITIPASLFTFGSELEAIKGNPEKIAFLGLKTKEYGENVVNFAVTDPVGFTLNTAGSIVAGKLLYSVGGEIKSAFTSPKLIASTSKSTANILTQTEKEFSAAVTEKINTPSLNAATKADLIARGVTLSDDINSISARGLVTTLIERKNLEGLAGGSRVYTQIERGLGTFQLNKALKNDFAVSGGVGRTTAGDSFLSGGLTKRILNTPELDILKSMELSKSAGLKDNFITAGITRINKLRTDIPGSGSGSTAGGVTSSGPGRGVFAWDVGPAVQEIKLLDMTSKVSTGLAEITAQAAEDVASRGSGMASTALGLATRQNMGSLDRAASGLDRIEAIDTTIIKSVVPREKTESRSGTINIPKFDVGSSDRMVSRSLNAVLEIPAQKETPINIMSLGSINAQIDRQRQEVVSIPIKTTRTKTDTGLVVLPPPIIIPRIPDFIPPSSPGGSMDSINRELNRVFKIPESRYKPSLEAVELGIKDFKVPDIITGFELRPIKRKRRHKK